MMSRSRSQAYEYEEWILGEENVLNSQQSR